MASQDDDFRTINLPPDAMPAGFSAEGDDGTPKTFDFGNSDDPDEGDMVDSALKIEIGEDGDVVIDLSPTPKSKKRNTGKFDDNLAEEIDAQELMSIGARLLSAIEDDDRSRQEWLQTRARGLDLLGFQLEEPHTDAGSSAAPLEGMSTVRHPLLAEAVIRFQSNASAELLPAWGPVKVRNDATPQPPDEMIGHNGGPPLDDDPNAPQQQDGDELAEALEKDFNYYLTAVDRGYRADFDRMLFWVGFGGCGFRKVYNDPIRRMPLSRSVAAEDLIVNHAESDFDDCRRVTHKVMMRKSQLKRMMLAGVYRNIDLSMPIFALDDMQRKIAEVQGFNTSNSRPEDAEFTIYECYCELDLKGYEHKDDGEISGLELPYRVTIDKDSRQVLEIRRNWAEDDPECIAKKTFVKYPFVPAFGFYEIGLLHILGNSTKALTGAWREALDAGMFANFPGFLYADTGGRQVTNEFRVPPGGGMRVQTGGKPIQQAIMPLPYHEMGAGMMTFMTNIETTAQRVGGTAELQVGEGKQDAPVGTTLALIEQATKMLSAVHVRLHAAQSEEFQLLKDRFRENPSALWSKSKGRGTAWTEEQFLQALDNYDLVPAADPNNPSHMQRIMKAIAIKQLQAMSPQLYNAMAVDRKILNMMGLTDIDHLFNQNPTPPPAAPPPDPAKMAMIQQKQQAMQMQAAQKDKEMQAKAANQAAQQDSKQKQLAMESMDHDADRQSREKVAQMREATESIKVQGELAQHQTASGDNILDSHVELAKHQMPSASDQLGSQTALAQHNTPSAADQLGAQTAAHQHSTPSADAQASIFGQPPQGAIPPEGAGPFAGGGAVDSIWKRPV
jgi:hypothetical protein